MLESSRAGSLSQFDAAFDYVSNIVVSPVTGTVLVTNNASGVYRSDDGGMQFEHVLGTVSQHAYNEIAVGSDGKLIATLSTLGLNGSHNATGGVYRSQDDGVTWTNITPTSYPSTHQRSLVALAPSNPDRAYILTFVIRDSNGIEDFRFHQLDLETGNSEERTNNLPNFPGSRFHGAQLYGFNNYAMVLGVKPDDENFVLLGGIALYRSRDGFATPLQSYRQARIGGYREAALPATSSDLDLEHWDFYPNHYVDQHAVAFHPEHPDEMWSANDGGIALTRDVGQASVVWEEKKQQQLQHGSILYRLDYRRCWRRTYPRWPSGSWHIHRE